MSLNIVLNNEPTKPIALAIDAIPAEVNQPHGPEPPGASGASSAAAPSELQKGNPGGVNAAPGVGLIVDAST